MEVLDRIGDKLNSFTGSIEKGLTGLFGSSNERRVKQIGFYRDKAGTSHVVPGSLLDTINGHEEAVKTLTDDELKQSAAMFRARLSNGETLDDILPEAFARVRESAWRALKMRHYDVQMVGGVILHRGMIAEMATGEGKTLVGSGPAFLNALAGSVHIVTVNDYLARRDMEWMGPIFLNLGLTVGAIQSQMNAAERQAAYACDITYGTNNEFGFDYLRDNMKPRKDQQVQGPLTYAIVDEIDNILIDEARTPLIISGPAHDDITKYAKADKIARQLKAGEDADFEIKEKERSCHMTESGVRRAEELAGVDSFYTAGNMEWPHLIDNALRAHHLHKRDVDYVVEPGDDGRLEVVIVDEHTGRKMVGRQWSDGLHQAAQAKEGVPVRPENQTLATITLQNFFKLYDKLSGMTGTAMTEASEFWQIYKLDVVNVPTNKPNRRDDITDSIFRSEKEKWDVVAEDAVEIHKSGRPILIGTTSIEASELVSKKLVKRGVKHNVLNAKQQEREADIVAQAGRKNAVTIATNMAGRGTDIILGGNPEYLAWEELKQKYNSRLDVSKSEWDATTDAIAEREGMKAEGREVAELGGLHVMGTERHDSRRIDNQLRGRAGRQGDPGSARFYLSLEDKLMRLFAGEWLQNAMNFAGVREGEDIGSGIVARQIKGAQKKIEERHFDQRKNLLEYDEVMDDQRKQVYGFRNRVLGGTDCRGVIEEMLDRVVTTWTEKLLDPNYRWETLCAFVRQSYGIDVAPNQVRGQEPDDLIAFLREEAKDQADEIVREQVEVSLPSDEDEREWNWVALSRWANQRYGLNTNDRELKKVGRDEVDVYLRERAEAAIDRVDFSPTRTLLEEDFPQRELAGWARQQFTVDVEAADLAGLDIPSAKGFILDKLRAMYRQKEVAFPVSVGLTRFVDQQRQLGPGGNPEELARWASGRFQSPLSDDSLRGKTREEIEGVLSEKSAGFFANGEVTGRIDDFLDAAYGTPEPVGKKKVELPTHALDAAPVAELAAFARENFKADLDADELAALPRDAARDRVFDAYQQYYRPELAHAERMLVLEILDGAWKDHLYFMDHLRSAIGLVGYAQQDPKTEYKKEGRKAFRDMWDRIDQQVTGAIFRLEKESKDFVGNLWQVTSATHAAPAADAAPAPQPATAESSAPTGPEPGQRVEAVEPIKNNTPKVGRNDPCPCGSGKKFKKCCGAG